MTQRGQESGPTPHSQSEVDQLREMPKASPHCHSNSARDQRAEGHRTA